MPRSGLSNSDRGHQQGAESSPKKVWPTFPLQVGMFSLLDFGHSKVEATALEDVKLVDIEFKRHDPHKIMENHLAQYNLKKYVHENSPHDEIFRGARSYEEVLNRVQSFVPRSTGQFLQFSKAQKKQLAESITGRISSTFVYTGNCTSGF
jgi:hypothetical protein